MIVISVMKMGHTHKGLFHKSGKGEAGGRVEGGGVMGYVRSFSVIKWIPIDVMKFLVSADVLT